MTCAGYEYSISPTATLSINLSFGNMDNVRKFFYGPTPEEQVRSLLVRSPRIF